jgi:signal transduction histidine kinase
MKDDTDKGQRQYQESRLSDIQPLAIALAHKIRGRLGVIQAAIYNIKQKASNPQVNSSIDKIERNVAELSKVITSLVAFTQIGMPSYEKTHIYDILEECLENAQSVFTGWEVTVRKEYDRISGSQIDVDPLQIKAAFAGLLSNAYESLAGRTGEIEVNARLDGAGGEMVVRIKDSGAGISADNLAKICEPFFSTKTEGVGLGLTSCYKIVELHGGRIEIESEIEKGTTVTVHLPGRVTTATGNRPT